MSSRDWLLNLASMELQDEATEGECQKKVALHRRRHPKTERLEYQEIDASQNRISWHGCKAIVDVSLQCQDLRVVKLFRNQLTDLAAPSLCRLVEECAELEQLHLSYNQLTGQGASEIITAASNARGRRLEKRERHERGITLWLRLEHNRIRRSSEMLEELWQQKVDFCEARDAQKCGPRVCKRCALVHLPYFSKQDSDAPLQAAAPPVLQSASLSRGSAGFGSSPPGAAKAEGNGAAAPQGPAAANAATAPSSVAAKPSVEAAEPVVRQPAGDSAPVPRQAAGPEQPVAAQPVTAPPVAAPLQQEPPQAKLGSDHGDVPGAAEGAAGQGPSAADEPQEQGGRQRKRKKKLKKEKGEKKQRLSSDGCSGSEGLRAGAARRRRREAAAAEEEEAPAAAAGKDSSSKATATVPATSAPPAALVFKPVQVAKKKPAKDRTNAAAKLLGGDESDEKEKDSKDERQSKRLKDEHDSGGRGSVPGREEGKKDGASKEGKSDGASKEAKAKGVPSLGDIQEMQKRLEGERNKLRLWVIKARQEWEERQERRQLRGQEARGETNEEDYYVCSVGELFGPSNELRAEGSIGKGVFSSVFRVKNTRQGTEYAVKFIRSNHMMRKAADKEVETYRRLARLAPKEDAEAAQFLMFLAPPETFVHQGHLCMVFELLKCDLRTALQKYGHGRGLPLQTVVQYSRQILMALRVLRKVRIIHGDLKPDNVLMSMGKTEVKVCDFGSSMDIDEEIKTAYMQPRYYRAPEIIVGIPYNTQIDMWSAGATLFEMGSGRILFTGKSNNAMLRQMLEVCGAFPKKMATMGTYSSKHFDPDGSFLHRDPDSITGEPEVMPMKGFPKPARSIHRMLERILREPPPNADAKTQERLCPRLAELVRACLRLDPAERMTPDLALEHPFFRKDK